MKITVKITVILEKNNPVNRVINLPFINGKRYRDFTVGKTIYTKA